MPGLAQKDKMPKSKTDKLEKWDIVLIEWHDAECDTGWASVLEDFKEENLCHSIGFLQDNSKKGIRIVQTISQPDEVENVNNSFFIPRPIIKRVVKIATPRRKANRRSKV